MKKQDDDFSAIDSSIIKDILNSEKSDSSRDIKLIYELNDDRKEWMHTIYEEAWRLYRHEDENAAQRNNSYLTVFVLLFTGVGYIAFHMIESFSINGLSDPEFCIKAAILSLLVLMISILIITLLNSWRRVTRAGHVFELLREDIIINIENELGKELNGKTESTDNSTKASKTYENPFSIVDYQKTHEEEKLEGLSKKESNKKKAELDGFINTERIITIFEVFAWITLVVSALIISLLMYLLFTCIL